jgi:hypothetical protein
MLADKFLAKEFPSFMSVERLLGLGKSGKRVM